MILTCCCALLLAFLNAGPAMAGLLDVEEPTGLSISAGESRIFPSLRLDYLADDNPLRLSGDEIENNGFVLRPSAQWRADRGSNSIVGLYEGAFFTGEESNADFADSTFYVEFDGLFSRRSRVNASALLEFGHEELGTNFTRDNPFDNEVTTFRTLDLTGDYIFGASTARLNLIPRLRIQSIEFTNNELLVGGASRVLFQPSIDLSFRLTGETRGFVRTTLSRASFDDSLRDRTGLSGLLGLTWASTGRLIGSAGIGITNEQPENDDLDDQSFAIVEASISYNPRAFSRFRLSMQRGTFDNELINQGIAVTTSDDIRLEWFYDWSSRLNHKLTLDYEAINRECPGISEDTTGGEIEVGVQVRRWISFGFSGQIESRSGSDCGSFTSTNLEFDRTAGGVFLRVTL